MSLGQWVLLIAGVIGVTLVALCPPWVYLDQELMPEKINLGYRFITQPPQPTIVSKQENAHTIIYANKPLVPWIDFTDLSVRIGMIVVMVGCGIWALRVLSRNREAWNGPEMK